LDALFIISAIDSPAQAQPVSQVNRHCRRKPRRSLTIASLPLARPCSVQRELESSWLSIKSLWRYDAKSQYI